MLKKILLGIGLVSLVATAGFGEEVKLDNNFCKAYNYATYNYLVDENYSNAEGTKFMIEQVSSKNAGDQRFTAMYGALSTDMLKDKGVGVSINMNWGNVVVAYSEFMRYAHSDEDKKELRKFQLSLLLLNKCNNSSLSPRECVIDSTQYIYSENLKGKNNNAGAILLTYKFALTKSKEKGGTEFYTFSKYVINGDYSRALEYIKKVNVKSGINKVYSEFENACEK